MDNNLKSLGFPISNLNIRTKINISVTSSRAANVIGLIKKW